MFMSRLFVFPDADHPYDENILKIHDAAYEKELREQMERAENE